MLYYVRNGNVVRATRRSVDSAWGDAMEFGKPVPVDSAILFPDDATYAYASWTGDGRQLIVSVARDGDDTDMYFAVCE